MYMYPASGINILKHVSERFFVENMPGGLHLFQLIDQFHSIHGLFFTFFVSVSRLRSS